MRPYHWFLIAAAANGLAMVYASALGERTIGLVQLLLFLIALVCAWVMRRAK